MWPTFLSPWLPVAAAGLVLPPLLLLYFLKLRRRPQPVSCTLLWKRAVQDLQVNSPFQRLRNNLLLILQLLILLLALLAMARPMIEVRKPLEDRVAILIDHSASMATGEAGGRTRLQIAKEQAHKLVTEMREGTKAMIVPFATVARTLGPLTSDKGELRRQIDSIGQSAGYTRMREAVALAGASATPIGEGIGTPDNPVAPLQIQLISDGRIEDALELPPVESRLEMIRVGAATVNVGIVGLDVRREYDRPEVVSVLARLRNFGLEPVDTDLAVYLDGRLNSAQPIHLAAGYDTSAEAAAQPAKAGETDLPVVPQAEPEPPEGSVSPVAFELTYPAAAILEVRLGTDDAFPADDRAFAVLLPARRVSVLLVSDQACFRGFFERMIPGLPLASHTWMTTGEYEQADESALTDAGRSKFDVVIFDGHDTARLPPGAYLFFGGVPVLAEEPGEEAAGRPAKRGVVASGVVPDELIVDWNDTHPVLRYVSVERLRMVETRKLEMPDDAVRLVEGETTPVVSYLVRDGRQYLIVGFHLARDLSGGTFELNTAWVHRKSFPIFIYNALRFLSATSTLGARDSVDPGEAVTIPVARSGGDIEITKPGGASVVIDPRGRLEVRFAGTDKVGVYRVSGTTPLDGAFAVNLFSEKESNIRPVDRLIVGGQAAIISGATQRVNQPLWPPLLLIGFAVLFLEWYIYTRRARV